MRLLGIVVLAFIAWVGVSSSTLADDYSDLAPFTATSWHVTNPSSVLEDLRGGPYDTQIAQRCCKVCSKGKPCGNTCIARNKTCHKGPGCACTSGVVLAHEGD